MNSSTSHGSTKNFMSFSSQSVIENSKGPSFTEKMKANCYFLAINLQRYKGFSSNWISFAAIFRIIQCYAVILMPGCTDFWKSDSHSSIFINILTLPIHLCFVPGDTNFHSIMAIIFCVILVSIVILTVYFLLKDPKEYSFTNVQMYLISFLYGVIVPIFTTFALSCFGTLLKHVIFFGYRLALLYCGLAFSCISALFVIPLNLLSFALIRARNAIDLHTFYATWSSQTWVFFSIDMILAVLALLEEFLPLNNVYYMIGYCCAQFILNNPGTIYLSLSTATFQDQHDAIYYCIMSCSTMLSIILMIMQHYVKGLTPAIVFIVMIIGFAIFLFSFNVIYEMYSNRVIRKITSVYKYNRPVLPPTSPLVFTQPEAVNVGLTQDAYQVIQAFDSLNIKSAAEFHKYVSIATDAKLPAATNLDLIKWGLYHFHDYNTLVDSAQICLHFGDVNQVLSVIIQHIKENGEPPFFMSFAIQIIDSLHIDCISDSPELFKMLEKKAAAGLTRCRRTTALFWGCVLNHSYLSMKEALCRMRDTISGAKSHFDELTRCYPHSKSTIQMYLSFLTEVRGYYMETNRYINDISSHMIEIKAEQDVDDDDETLDILSDVLNDVSQSFYPYTSDLSSFMEQERLANSTSHAPMISLWVLASVSLLVIIACLVFVIAETLVTFNTYPQLLNIIKSCTTLITKMASLSIGARRMCLFSKHYINTDSKLIPFGNLVTDASVYDNDTVLMPHFISEAETLTQYLQDFYKKTAYSDYMLQVLEQRQNKFLLYGYDFYGSLSFALDLMTNSIRNVAGNIPDNYVNQKLIKPFSMSTLDSFQTLENRKSTDEEIHKQREYFFSLLNTKLKEKPNIETHFHFESPPLPKVTDTSNGKIDRQPKITTYDPVEMYATTCQSPCIKHVILNIEPQNQLLVTFFNEFLGMARTRVDNLASILQYSMILLPIIFVVLFCTLVGIVSYFVVQESNFRTTLYLSLPEQVASEIFRAGGHTKYFKNDNRKGNEETCDLPMLGSTQAPAAQASQFNGPQDDDNDYLKEKAITIESLHHFSGSESGIRETGIRHFIAWSIVYILVGAIGMFCITFYSQSINDSFYARSELISEAALRFLRILYASLMTSEYFFQDNDIKLMEPSEVYRLATGLLDRGFSSNQILTYGNNEIPYDFRDYDGIKKLIIKQLGENRANVPTEAFPSYGTIQHDGYKQFGFDTKYRVFTSFLRGLNDNFNKDINKYQRNGQVWEQFDHMFFGHLMSETESTISIYSQSVDDVISTSFLTALTISIVLLVVLVLIFILPLRTSLNAMSNYFDLTLHTICMIPKDVFTRSVYIGKWLKGEISVRNYHQYETNFKRTVSARIQTKILQESPEKILVFNTDGRYMHIGEEPEPDDTSLEKLLALHLDLEQSQHIQENIEKAFAKYNEAKDSIEAINYKALSAQGNPVRVTIRGIPTSEVAESTNITKYYAYVVILFRDITQESSEYESYKKQKEKTIALIAQCVPYNFAKKLHDGERRIAFSAGIGTVTNVEICNYWQHANKMDPTLLSKCLLEMRLKIDELLKEFTNMSLITFDSGTMTFVAGLFNDEQNGRTEAIDSLHFSFKLYQELKGIFIDNNIKEFHTKFGIATGGPIYCKLLMDAAPIIIISDDTANISEAIVKTAKQDQMLLERTSYECIYGINVDATLVGDFESSGKRTSLYSINMLTANIQTPQQQV